jgi:hypothetical protein
MVKNEITNFIISFNQMILQTLPNGSIPSEEYLPSRSCFESAINS